MKYKVENYSGEKCPDCYFGTIEFITNPTNTGWQWFSIESSRHTDFENKKLISGDSPEAIESENSENPKLVLILESPRYNEYDSTGAPIRPANGTTGQNIFEHLCSILNNNNPHSGKYCNLSTNLQGFLKAQQTNNIDVWIVNAIQYQCSMGIRPINHIIKESNWIDEWCSGGNDLLNRCGTIGTIDIFFVNLCTKGNYVPMKQLVEDEVVNNLSSTNYCKGPHPSSWTRIRKVVEFIN
jgi:hypothetical protein